jgi:hypothetical protein
LAAIPSSVKPAPATFSFQYRRHPVAFSLSGSVLRAATNAVKKTFLTVCPFIPSQNFF